LACKQDIDTKAYIHTDRQTYTHTDRHDRTDYRNCIYGWYYIKWNS